MQIQYESNFKIVDARSKREVCADEVKEEVNRIMKVFEAAEIQKSDVMYIGIERSIDTVLTIVACLQLHITFTFCKSSKSREFKTTLIFDGEKVTRIAYPLNNENLEICYVINTSGTSGNGKKQVAVPVDCIRRNIEHFCSLFEVSASDSILFSTSLLFDPSIVELFMAFHVGCKLILTPDSFRSEPHRMQKAIEEFRPTIAQFTPTVFEMLPSPDSFLSSTSSLQILLLGGSHFPLHFINSNRNSDNTTRIFNVYGVTEVSCWATAFEVERGCSEVAIGDEIAGTTLEVDSNGELVLGGSRQCYVNGRKAEKHRTGDRVEKTKSGGLKIVGRVDNVVKHQGTRVCLDRLNEIALREMPPIQSSHVIHYKNRNLIQFITSTEGTISSSSRIVRLDEITSVMVTMIQVNNLPINSSGKVDENELRRICDERFNETLNIQDKIREILKERLDVHLVRVMDQSFVEVGVNSLMAAEISLYFGDNQENAIGEILDDRRTIRSVLETFEAGTSRVVDSKIPVIAEVKVPRKRQPRMKWAIDLKKCIDGNVLVIRNDCVVCASHSGVVVAVNPLNGECLWRTECNVRFECEPILVKKEIVIGSKNHALWFLCVETGDILEIKVLDQGFGVRSKCTFDGSYIYCTTENGYFHAISPENRFSVFSHCVEPNGGGTSVGSVISPDGSVFATTTSGFVTRIAVKPILRILSSKRFGPIFSEPIFIEDNTVLITSVHGILKILDLQMREELDSIKLVNENCFCAPLRIENSLLVATQSGRIVILHIKPRLEMSRIFKFDLPGISFVKTPRVLNDFENSAELMMMSNNGWLLHGEFSCSEKFEKLEAIPISNKEVFTSPEVIEMESKNLVLIAGRDDYLRCFQFDK